MMVNVLLFPSKPTPAARRLLSALPSDETPFTVTIPAQLAKTIRHASAWAGRSPEAQVLAYLEAAFLGRARDA